MVRWDDEWRGHAEVPAVEWEVLVPGRPEPVAVIRRTRQRDDRPGVFRVVTYAERSEGRVLIGRWSNFDGAAEGAWRAYCDSQTSRHEAASRTHGSHERG